MKPIPILFLGDSPHLHTGLARIGRDLASLVSTLPQFRVGYLGRGGHGSAQLPFTQYNFPEQDQWGEAHIETVWMDFARDDRGIIFSIWDVGRLHWFANPTGIGAADLTGIGGRLEDFLRSDRFDRWGYFPIDSYGVGGRLTVQAVDTLRHYNRVLAYGGFGAEVISRSIGEAVDWIPHGINLDIFEARDRSEARMSMGFRPDDLVIGAVMSNQQRKDWGLAFATIASLRNAHPNLKFWAHVDVLRRHWDLRALTADFGLDRTVLITSEGQFSDTELSYGYSACDLTILPSLGEGFGYPIVESLACGVPVVHGNYGGGRELIPDETWLVDPIGERLDTPHNCIRPVFNPTDWVRTVERVVEHPMSAFYCRNAVSHLDWKLLWPSAWKKFFLGGIGKGESD